MKAIVFPNISLTGKINLFWSKNSPFLKRPISFPTPESAEYTELSSMNSKMFRKKKKEPKIITEVRNMSDEEFLEYYKKYYINSGIRISGGLLLAVICVILIIVLL